jgi:AcrR family transcriptional regulator
MSLREEKKTQTRQMLIDKAIGLFSAQGLEATTVDQIAEAANTGKGTFYNYFDSKEAVIVAFMARLEAEAMPATRRYADLDAPAGEVLSKFAWDLLHRKRNHRPFMRVFLARMIARDESFHRYVVEMQAAIDETLDLLFTRLKQRGLIAEEHTLEHLRITFKTMHLGLTMLWLLEEPPHAQTRRVLKTQMQMFALGVAP